MEASVMMDKTRQQELFNKAWLGMKSQGWQKSASGGTCWYRSPDGKRCAVGWLIPDDKYEQWFEGHGVISEITEAIGCSATDDSRYWLERLQSLHDDEFSQSSREVRFRLFARDEDLTIPGEEGAS